MVNPDAGFFHISIRYLTNCKLTRLQAVYLNLSNTLPHLSLASQKLDFNDRDHMGLDARKPVLGVSQ